MTRAWLAALAAVAVGAGCKTFSTYTKGPPMRVAIDKQVGAPLQLAVATRDDSGRVAVRVLALQEVRATRRTRHGSLETRTMHPGHIWYELLEVPLGALFALVPPLLVMDFNEGDRGQPDRKIEPLRVFLAALNPAQAVFAGKRKVFVSREVTFDAAPRVRQYNVRLPVAEHRVRYRLLGPGREVLAEAEAVTDVFGRFDIPFVGPDVVGVEITGDGWTTIAPVEGPLPAPPAPATEPPAPTP